MSLFSTTVPPCPKERSLFDPNQYICVTEAYAKRHNLTGLTSIMKCPQGMIADSKNGICRRSTFMEETRDKKRKPLIDLSEKINKKAKVNDDVSVGDIIWFHDKKLYIMIKRMHNKDRAKVLIIDTRSNLFSTRGDYRLRGRNSLIILRGKPKEEALKKIITIYKLNHNVFYPSMTKKWLLDIISKTESKSLSKLIDYKIGDIYFDSKLQAYYIFFLDHPIKFFMYDNKRNARIVNNNIDIKSIIHVNNIKKKSKLFNIFTDYVIKSKNCALKIGYNTFLKQIDPLKLYNTRKMYVHMRLCHKPGSLLYSELLNKYIMIFNFDADHNIHYIEYDPKTGKSTLEKQSQYDNIFNNLIVKQDTREIKKLKLKVFLSGLKKRDMFDHATNSLLNVPYLLNIGKEMIELEKELVPVYKKDIDQLSIADYLRNIYRYKYEYLRDIPESKLKYDKFRLFPDYEMHAWLKFFKTKLGLARKLCYGKDLGNFSGKKPLLTVLKSGLIHNYSGFELINQNVKQCKEAGYELLFVPIRIKIMADSSHSNGLIFDLKGNRVIRFEPHGSVDFYDANEVNQLMRNLFPNFKYIAPLDYCPMRGPQYYSSKYAITEERGYCTAITMLFLYYILKYPERSEKEIVQAMIKTHDDMFLHKIRVFANNLSRIQRETFTKKILDEKNTYAKSRLSPGDTVQFFKINRKKMKSTYLDYGYVLADLSNGIILKKIRKGNVFNEAKKNNFHKDRDKYKVLHQLYDRYKANDWYLILHFDEKLQDPPPQLYIVPHERIYPYVNEDVFGEYVNYVEWNKDALKQEHINILTRLGLAEPNIN